jgi:CRP-like cAMP-binding protein
LLQSNLTASGFVMLTNSSCMHDILEHHLLERLGTNTSQLDVVLSKFRPIEAKRGSLLLREGEICRQVYFIAKGCLQVFVFDHEMNENTRDIIIENNWCSELISFGSGKPSTENIRAVEHSQLLAIDQHSFREMMHQVPQFETVYRQILESSYANSVYRINTFVAMSALERIKWMMEVRPTLMTRLSSKLIASYLGISQETFSRLKGRL